MDTNTAPAAGPYDPDDLAAAIARNTTMALCFTCWADGAGGAAREAAQFTELVDAAGCDLAATHDR